MLMILAPLTATLITTWLTPPNRLWEVSMTQSLMTAALSTTWFYTQCSIGPMTHLFFIDNISSPLLILTCWLTAPALLASQSKLMKEPITHQRIYIFTIITLQTTTLLAFLANNFILFFIFFEATMIPTLIIITRWGAQKERMLAGTYLLFYTLFGSMALLTALLFFYTSKGTLTNLLIQEIQFNAPPYPILWWTACFLAFLVKMPLFGLHLWLPKAHVEAPIAGSMILASTLLKLGGYGILRLNTMMPNPPTNISTFMVSLSLLGVTLSSILCSRQTDLKSLIAFSSISHMGLVIAASLLKTQLSTAGSMALMISHGLTSSAMFCLANTSYERTNTRTLTTLQGAQIMFPLMASWWLLTSLFNMALPPSPNFTGELLILTSLLKWSNLTILVTGLSMIFTSTYSLYLFWSSQRESLPKHFKSLPPTQTREHTLIILHLTPTIILATSPNFLF